MVVRGEPEKILSGPRSFATAAELFSDTDCIVSLKAFTLDSNTRLLKRQLAENQVKMAWNADKRCAALYGTMLLHTTCIWVKHNGCQIRGICTVINQFKATAKHIRHCNNGRVCWNIFLTKQHP